MTKIDQLRATHIDASRKVILAKIRLRDAIRMSREAEREYRDAFQAVEQAEAKEYFAREALEREVATP